MPMIASVCGRALFLVSGSASPFKGEASERREHGKRLKTLRSSAERCPLLQLVDTGHRSADYGTSPCRCFWAGREPRWIPGT